MARSRPRKPRSPLEAREQELANQQHLLQSQIEALQRSIEDAPRVAAEEARRRREELLAERTSGADGSSALPDKRFAGQRGARGGSGGRRDQPLLKAERNAAKLKALALSAALIILLIWVLTYFL